MEPKVSILRHCAEITLGGITVRRRLPASVGSGIVLANVRVGGLKYLFRASKGLDPGLLAVTKALVAPGNVVWDVGGNVGLFAVAAAGLAGSNGSVFTFEPDADAFLLLTKTVQIRQKGHAHIEAICVAIAGSPSITRFNIAKRSRSANAIEGYGSTQTGGTQSSRLVPAISLDLLLGSLPVPQVVKIDVEGAEALVLSGANTLLSKVRPRLLVEVSHEHSIGIGKTLETFGYRLFDGATLVEVAPGLKAPWDTIGLPKEQPVPKFVGRTNLSP